MVSAINLSQNYVQFCTKEWKKPPYITVKEIKNLDTKKAIPKDSDAQPEIFQGRGGFVKLGHFDKHFIKKLRKKAPQGKILEFFLLDTLKTTF